MTENFDDELARMDELEEQADSALFEALSLDDPIIGLTLRHHPTVQSGTTLQTVIKILRDEKVGCVMVEKDSRIIGVMTERDFLLRAIAKELDMTTVTIDDYMTKNPETLHPDDPISYALNKMHVFGIRHIPIVEESGTIQGMISVKDIISHIGNYFGEEIVNLPPEPARKALHRPEGG